MKTLDYGVRDKTTEARHAGRHKEGQKAGRRPEGRKKARKPKEGQKAWSKQARKPEVG